MTFLRGLPYNGLAMKKTVLRGILLSLLLALAAAGFLLYRAQSRLEGLQAQADSLLEEKNYGAAMTAYGRLLQRTPLSFFGGDRPFVIRGAAGVLSCGSALLDTPEGAALLAADFFSLGLDCAFAALLFLEDKLGEHSAREPAIRFAAARLAAFDGKGAWDMHKAHDGGGLVRLLAARSAAENERFL